MQPLKIIITLLVLVIFGIVVGSNLLPMMTVTILNQPTMALPIGIWLIIALSAGILSSISIQLLLFLQQRSLTKKIRQLQTRLQERDEDFFTYTSSSNQEPVAEPKIDPPPASGNRFSFRRTRTQPTSNQSDPSFSSPQPAQPIEVIDDDWLDQPRSNRQLDWDDVPPQPSRATAKAPTYSNPFPTERDRIDTRSNQNRQPEPARIDEVYDADFRLIQPPYKQPLEPEELEYDDEDEEEYLDRVEAEDLIPAKESNRHRNLDEEDWGFDFDDESEEVETSRSRNRKN